MAGAASGRGEVGAGTEEVGSGWTASGFAEKTTESVEQASDVIGFAF